MTNYTNQVCFLMGYTLNKAEQMVSNKAQALGISAWQCAAWLDGADCEAETLTLLGPIPYMAL